MVIKGTPAEKYMFKRGDPRLKELGAKGGSAKTPRKKLALKIASMKKRGCTNKEIDWVIQKMDDPDVSIFDMLVFIDEIRGKLKPAQQLQLLNAMATVHKLRHGEKIKTENVHHVINWSDVLSKCKIEDDRRLQSEKDSEETI